MKNFKILSALILCVVCFITACTTTTPNPSNTTPAAGTWKITSFIDDSKDETSDYNGYTFDFDSNGVRMIAPTNS
jgi:outer membrane biogenesis lipoprotein LolB